MSCRGAGVGRPVLPFVIGCWRQRDGALELRPLDAPNRQSLIVVLAWVARLKPHHARLRALV